MILSEDVRLGREIYQPINRAIFDTAAFALFLVGQMRAITPLYGTWSRDFCLLEAGLMTQLLEISAPDAGIGLCQIGGFEFDTIHHWFALDEGHVYLHSLIGGPIDKNQTQLQALVMDSSESRFMIDALKQLGGDNGSPQPRTQLATSSQSAAPFDTDRLGDELRRFLGAKLPAYMIPSDFVFIDVLPLTSNGKIDRRALLERNASNLDKGRVFAPPQTDIEQRIVSIWQEVLQVHDIGIHDSFFELGGNSIQLVMVHNKLSQVLEQDITIATIFEHPTVYTLATYLNRNQNPSHDALQQSHDRAQPRKSLMQSQRLRRKK
jgi:acyl carrier protein